MLIQSVYASEADWKRISKMVQSNLDVEDGGIEGLLLGPPLVGIFEIADTELKDMSF